METACCLLWTGYVHGGGREECGTAAEQEVLNGMEGANMRMVRAAQQDFFSFCTRVETMMQGPKSGG
jgi:hypothetical protein